MSWRAAAAVLLLGAGLALAQDGTATPTPAPLASAQDATLLTGRLDRANPRQTYSFEGSRGEVVRLSLRSSSGDLDPLLSLFDPQGRLVQQRDDGGGVLDAQTTVTLNADGRYLLVVSRWGEALGSTEGDYELRVERIGILSVQGSSLRYGSPVTNALTDEQPLWYYTFRARQGDILDIEMVRSSGTLDPSLKLLDSEQFLLASNDDADPSTRNAAIRNFFIEQDGVYIVVATRYGEEAGDSAGSFVLSVQEAQDSGVGNSPLAPSPIAYNQTLEGALDAQRENSYFRFIGQENDIVTLAANLASGRLDVTLTLATPELQALASDDDSGGGQNARIDRFRLPYSGAYTVIVGRFGDGQGGFRLNLQRNGSAFEGIDPTMPRLLYGTTVSDAITPEDTSSQYAFWGDAGDVIALRMARSSGTLDPALELLDAQGRRLFRADNTAPIAAFDRLSLPYTGVYIIYARRYEGALRPADTTGAFSITLALLEAGRQGLTPTPVP